MAPVSIFIKSCPRPAKVRGRSAALSGLEREGQPGAEAERCRSAAGAFDGHPRLQVEQSGGDPLGHMGGEGAIVAKRHSRRLPKRTIGVDRRSRLVEVETMAEVERFKVRALGDQDPIATRRTSSEQIDIEARKRLHVMPQRVVDLTEGRDHVAVPRPIDRLDVEIGQAGGDRIGSLRPGLRHHIVVFIGAFRPRSSARRPEVEREAVLEGGVRVDPAHRPKVDEVAVAGDLVGLDPGAEAEARHRDFAWCEDPHVGVVGDVVARTRLRLRTHG